MKNLVMTLGVSGLLTVGCAQWQKTSQVVDSISQWITMTLADSTSNASVVKNIFTQTPDLDGFADHILSNSQEITAENISAYTLEMSDQDISVGFVFDPEKLWHLWIATENEVAINLAWVEFEYNRSIAIVEQWYQAVAIPTFSEYLVCILRQELYHAMTPDAWNERVSELISLADEKFGAFYLVWRTGITYKLLMWYINREELTQAYPDVVQKEKYNEMYKNYVDAFLAVDPDFVQNNPTRVLLPYLQEHPAFLSDVCTYILAKEWL